jgi:hypothetical protein
MKNLERLEKHGVAAGQIQKENLDCVSGDRAELSAINSQLKSCPQTSFRPNKLCHKNKTRCYESHSGFSAVPFLFVHHGSAGLAFWLDFPERFSCRSMDISVDDGCGQVHLSLEMLPKFRFWRG